ncbi:hypothetical protein HNY73_001253 [Argiope bruennichi]|uniref:IRF tryptophan pentad repeat domain-containing protein n=1 Tax=Argiope bruennichi TaxID=94029 RepID=A0A8T0G351_ARGBR|nr:hypothetical protein HNY73_001253 [Argiope bruennichi]
MEPVYLLPWIVKHCDENTFKGMRWENRSERIFSLHWESQGKNKKNPVEYAIMTALNDYFWAWPRAKEYKLEILAIKERCLSVLDEALMQVEKRFPSARTLFKDLSKLSPSVVLSQVTRATFSELPFQHLTGEKLSVFEDQHRKLPFVDWREEVFNKELPLDSRVDDKREKKEVKAAFKNALRSHKGVIWLKDLTANGKIFFKIKRKYLEGRFKRSKNPVNKLVESHNELSVNVGASTSTAGEDAIPRFKKSEKASKKETSKVSGKVKKSYAKQNFIPPSFDPALSDISSRTEVTDAALVNFGKNANMEEPLSFQSQEIPVNNPHLTNMYAQQVPVQYFPTEFASMEEILNIQYNNYVPDPTIAPVNALQFVQNQFSCDQTFSSHYAAFHVNQQLADAFNTFINDSLMNMPLESLFT